MTAIERVAADPRARRVARRLAARGLPGLGEALVRLCGQPIGDEWRIDALYAVGAEGAVYTASGLTSADYVAAVVKIPLLPYHKPADISSATLRHRRDALREEAHYLVRAASPVMPRALGLVEFDNPLLDGSRGGPFGAPDPALVMEWLPGLDVDLWLARIHRSGLTKASLRKRLDALSILLLESLRDLESRGFFYADLRPGNLRVTGRPRRRLRLLDAGSLVEVGDASGRFPHVAHYLPPDLFRRRYEQDLDIVPSSAVQAVMAGRTLYEVATGFVPVPGAPVDRGDLRDCAVSPLVADTIEGLATGSFSGVEKALRYVQRQRARLAVRVQAGAAGEATPAGETATAATATAATAATATARASANGAAQRAATSFVPSSSSAPAPATAAASRPAPTAAPRDRTTAAATAPPSDGPTQLRRPSAPSAAQSPALPPGRGLWRHLAARLGAWFVRRPGDAREAASATSG